MIKIGTIHRRAADENATLADRFRHLAIAGIRARPLVGVLAVEGHDMQPARETRPADIHHHVVHAVFFIDAAADALEFVGDLAVHRRARQEPEIAAARPPFQKAEFAERGNAGKRIDRDLKRRNFPRLLVRDIGRLLALAEMIDHALDHRIERRHARPVESARDVPGAEPVLLPQRFPALVADRLLAFRGGIFRALAFRAAEIEIVRDPKQSRHEIRQLQRPAQFDDLFEIAVVGKCEMERAHHRRLRQQPHAHAGDDAEIRLRENAVENRPERIFRGMPVGERLRIQRAVAGAQQIAVAEHDFEPAGEIRNDRNRACSRRPCRARCRSCRPAAGLTSRRASACCRAGPARHRDSGRTTPGSTTAKASFSSISRMRFILKPRSTTTWPSRGAEREPSPIFCPVETG